MRQRAYRFLHKRDVLLMKAPQSPPPVSVYDVHEGSLGGDRRHLNKISERSTYIFIDQIGPGPK